MCTRCVHALGRVQGRVQGRVVAGRFWCSYAWVSLTQTACARPRGCLCACTRVCVPVGGVQAVCAWLGGAIPFSVSLSVVQRCAGGGRCLPLFAGRWLHPSFPLSVSLCTLCIRTCVLAFRLSFASLSPLSASLTPLLSISMTIKNGI